MSNKVDEALDAYRRSEQKRMAADLAEREWTTSIMRIVNEGTWDGSDERARYYAGIKEIDTEFTAKREKKGLDA